MTILFGALAAASAGEDKIPPIPAHPDQALFGSRIQRTMTLLATSNPNRRHTVRILFYGQSITEGAWWKVVDEELHRRFPHANLTVENRSIGGHGAPWLVRCAVHDLYPFYPDLVVFHVYGGETTGELERIFYNIRRLTTAEILTFTHHIAWPRDPKQDPAARRQSDDLSSDALRYLAQKYNCELVEVRKEWDGYLKVHSIHPQDFLGDAVHPNDKGKQLLAGLVLRHFQFNPNFPAGWFNMVRGYEARRAKEERADEIVLSGDPWETTKDGIVAKSAQSALTLTFRGNRVDVIAAQVSGKLGTATVRIDGKAPSTFPELYAATRPSKAPEVWWPALRRVTLGANAVIEDWTLKMTQISDDGRTFSYDVAGSVTGPDGSGTNERVFVSKSGRITIDPGDFGIAAACSHRKIKPPAGFEVTWKVVPLFMDTWKPQPIQDPSLEDRYILAQGLENREHVLEIIPNGDGPVAIREIVVHRPPME